MALSPIDNGDSGLVARNKINTAFAAVDAVAVPASTDLIGSDGADFTSVTVGDGLDLTAGTLSNPIPSADLIGGDGTDYASVSVGSGLDLTAGILTATGGGGGGYPVVVVEVGDEDYLVNEGETFIVLTAALTAPRTITLFAASADTAQNPITIYDAAGGVDDTNTLTIAPDGSDTINNEATWVLNGAFQSAVLQSNATYAWTVYAGNPLAGAPVLGSAALLDAGTVAGNVAEVRNYQFKFTAGAISQDGQNLFMCGKGVAATLEYIHTSADFGKNWKRRDAAGKRDWGAIACSADGQVVLAGSSFGYAYLSADGGVTWDELTSELGSHPWFGSACSDDGQTLHIIAENGAYRVSVDGGATWTPHVISGIAGVSLGRVLDCSADGEFVALATFGYIYTSDDAGATWTEQTASGSRDWRAIGCSADGSIIVGVVYSGGVYLSDDSGATWNVQAGAGTSTWTGVDVSGDGQLIIAAGSSGALARSDDGGTTWTTPPLINPIADLTFVVISSDGSSVLTGGTTGFYAYVSLDAGLTWKFYQTLRQVFSGQHREIVAGGAAGDISVPSITQVVSVLDEVIEYVMTLGAVSDIVDLTDQFVISNDATINNAGGSNTTGNKLLVRWTTFDV